MFQERHSLELIYGLTYDWVWAWRGIKNVLCYLVKYLSLFKGFHNELVISSGPCFEFGIVMLFSFKITKTT